ncbi:hypothetical protein B0H13DRAFT_1893567 [Mycena leptocephala]|nr:hypothetical protein B0H13DRAFT_1893567 [Mycena leptocephala]
MYPQMRQQAGWDPAHAEHTGHASFPGLFTGTVASASGVPTVPRFARVPGQRQGVLIGGRAFTSSVAKNWTSERTVDSLYSSVWADTLSFQCLLRMLDANDSVATFYRALPPLMQELQGGGSGIAAGAAGRWGTS